jgi:TPR repeat protein
MLVWLTIMGGVFRKVRLLLPSLSISVSRSLILLVLARSIDLFAAAEWWERAGNGDSLMKAAQTLLLKDSTLPPVDLNHVLHLFRRSANTGHAPAALSLGEYLDNNGARGEAIQWFMKAARQGDEEAREHLTRIQQRQQEQQRHLEEGEDDDEGEGEEHEEL